MKIGLIGNMNNSNFSLMRILRNEGYDAHLFLFKNEFFFPEDDTQDISELKKFIHNLGVSNGKPDILFFNKECLRDKLKTFNFLIGNGISPYILKKIHRKLNIFMPYGEGIEHINENTDNFKEIIFSKKNYKFS